MVLESCTVVDVCHVVSGPWLCVTVALQVLGLCHLWCVCGCACMRVHVHVCVFENTHMQKCATDPGTPRHHHHAISLPASLPFTEISDAQSTVFATDVTGTLNFKIHLKCKVGKSQVASVSLLSVNVVEMDLISDLPLLWKGQIKQKA